MKTKTRLEREFSSGGIVMKTHGSAIKILLIKDPYGKWTWPKGKIDKGESSLDAAKREVKEETGLENMRLISKIGQSDYFYERRKKLIYKTVYFYLFKYRGRGALSIQKSEIDDGRWFSEEEAPAKLGYKGGKELFKKAIRVFKRCGKDM